MQLRTITDEELRQAAEAVGLTPGVEAIVGLMLEQPPEARGDLAAALMGVMEYMRENPPKDEEPYEDYLAREPGFNDLNDALGEAFLLGHEVKRIKAERGTI